MLQLKNSTPFKTAMAVLPDEDGIDTLYAVIKATFSTTPAPEVAEEQIAPVLADDYWGEPGASSLKYASEMHLCKPSTDVVLAGQAWSENDRRVEELDVVVAVAEREQRVRVFGDRQWREGGSISPPKPFKSIPLVYERAYGGIVEGDEKLLAEERNPVGIGFAGGRSAEEIVGSALPNLEDPGQLLTTVGTEVAPAGFGFVAASWLPRREYAGTYDEAWQKSRAPYLPEDFDSRFFNAAHPSLVFDRFLEGGEPIRLVHASPAGRMRFELPKCEFDLKVRIAGVEEQPRPNLETVLLEPDDEKLMMTWRASVRCDKKAMKIEEVAIGLRSMDLKR